MTSPSNAALPLFKDDDRLHGYVTVTRLAGKSAASPAQADRVADILAENGFFIFMTTPAKVFFKTSARCFERELGVKRPDPNADFSETARPRDPRLAGLIDLVEAPSLAKARARPHGPN